MHQRILLTLLIGVSVISSNGQVQFTADNSVPPFGLYTCNYSGLYAIPAPTYPIFGTSVHWNFSQLNWEDLDIITWYVQPASWLGYEDVFPSANVAFWQLQSGGTQYFTFLNAGPDSMVVEGSANYLEGFGGSSSVPCIDPYVWLRYPAGIGDVVTLGPAICNGETSSLTREIVASGDLNLGFVEYENVLLFRHTVTVSGVAYVSYCWYAIGNAHDLVLAHSLNDNSFFARSCSVSATGVEEEASAEELILYPNPTTDLVWLVGEHSFGNWRIMVYDAQGREVLQKVGYGGERREFSVNGLANGAYTVRMDNGNMKRSKRLIVAR